MSSPLLLSAIGLVFILALPLMPGLVELLNPRDDEPLAIDQTYARDPRFFGRSLRAKLRPFVERAKASLPYREEIKLRRPEMLEVHRDLQLPARSKSSSILATIGLLEIGGGSRLGELYAQHAATVAPGATIRSLACDGDVFIGDDCNVLRWADAEGDVSCGERCELGQSVSAAGVLCVRQGSLFHRLWGLPITTIASVSPLRSPRSIDDVVVFGERGLSLPPGCALERDLVVRGELRVGAGSTIRGNIKAHGAVVVERGSKIEGNVVARQSVTIAEEVAIEGSVFSEGDVTVGSHTRIGDRGAFKTLYSLGQVSFGDDVTVFGWVVAERGGRIG